MHRPRPPLRQRHQPARPAHHPPPPLHLLRQAPLLAMPMLNEPQMEGPQGRHTIAGISQSRHAHRKPSHNFTCKCETMCISTDKHRHASVMGAFSKQATGSACRPQQELVSACPYLPPVPARQRPREEQLRLPQHLSAVPPPVPPPLLECFTLCAGGQTPRRRPYSPRLRFPRRPQPSHVRTECKRPHRPARCQIRQLFCRLLLPQDQQPVRSLATADACHELRPQSA